MSETGTVSSLRFNLYASGSDYHALSLLDTLSIDTGSANIFLGAQLNYIPTSLGVNSTQPVVCLFYRLFPTYFTLDILPLQTQSYVEGSSLRGKPSYFSLLI